MTNHDFWTRHDAYLKSPEWKAKRLRAFEHHGKRCLGCGTVYSLQVDHLTYRRHGAEEMRDLIILCASCHFRVTKARREAGAKMGSGYVRVTEELFGVTLKGVAKIDRGAVHWPGERPCKTCKKPTRFRRSRSCKPCDDAKRKAKRAARDDRKAAIEARNLDTPPW